ncbi:hypothetical protein ACIBL6_19285 [Streptomyces sp. NPDC050400]|uniref:hypothetical protein n=1 Tax=Streptomyces sp. NPDC050400 TaxID=3365610 RepID=UPI0037AE657B
MALSLLTTGCSPPELQLVAVGKGPHGDVLALLRPCSNAAHMEEVSIQHVAEEADGADPEALDGWSARPPQSVTGEQQISLYQPPKNWHGAAQPASKLSSAGFYSVDFIIGRKDAQSIIVKYRGIGTFKAVDVDGLAPGQWWADGKVMSRAQFREHADDVC